MSEACDNCKFFFYGICRRYPPQVIPFVSTESEGSMRKGDCSESVETELVAQFPSVDGNEWCGEWK